MKKLKFGLSQAYNHAPKWVNNSMAVLVVLTSAKHFLIDGLPGLSEEAKLLAKSWFEYAVDGAQLLLALAMIFLGEKKDSENPYI